LSLKEILFGKEFGKMEKEKLLKN